MLSTIVLILKMYSENSKIREQYNRKTHNDIKISVEAIVFKSVLI